jgi:DNA-directed RNA polymerase specialized sigma24 family protein
MPAPPSDPAAVEPSSDRSLPANDAAPSSARVVVSAVAQVPPPSGVTLGRVDGALRAFLASREKKQGRDFIKSVIIKRLGSGLNPTLMEDLEQAALTRALEAASPPYLVSGIPGWVSRVTKRAIADYFRAREDDEENLDHDAEAADQSERHAPQPDWGAREHLICQWLETQIGDDPAKVETFRLMMECNVVGRPVAEVAAENGMTASALSNRMSKLRKELAPRIAVMDREKPRLFILLGMLLFGVAAFIVAALVVLWVLLAPIPRPPRPPRVVPAPSASVAPPTFDQALPTAPSSLPDTDAGDGKPPPLKP